MFRPFSIFIGLRYTRAKRRNHFISFISMSSMLGIALGVAVLITVLSVMNGFDKEIKDRVFELAPQITIQNVNGAIDNWQQLANKVDQYNGVLASSPFVSGQGMLTHLGIVHAAMITGIAPTQEEQVSKIGTKMVAGSLAALKAGQFGIVLGQNLAEGLGLKLGDKVTLATPEASLSPTGIIPRFKRFTLVGVFHAGNGFGFDSQLGFINIQDAQKLFQLGQAVSGLRLKVKDLYSAPKEAIAMMQNLPEQYYATNWTQQYGPLFKAIKLEKTMMFLILLLIVAVAAFNLVASLVMVVADKRSDIAILRTLGATPRNIMATFIVQGFVVGAFGTLMGLIGGVLLAWNVTPIVALIQRVFHVQLLSSSIYYVNYLPSQIEWIDVIQICIAAFGLSLLATIYPAWRAARTQPAEALRYE